jgi:hypothetical protein
MLYVLLQVSLPCDFELVSEADRSFPSSTCIDDERDTERGADVFGVCFGELVLGTWRWVFMLDGVSGFLSGCAVRSAYNATKWST